MGEKVIKTVYTNDMFNFFSEQTLFDSEMLKSLKLFF